jgi:hypothetical protein
LWFSKDSAPLVTPRGVSSVPASGC